MTSSDVWDEATAAGYDRTSAHMFAADVLDPAVDFLAALAGHGDTTSATSSTCSGRVGAWSMVSAR